MTYGVAGCKLLLCVDYGAVALGGVEGGLASDDCLSDCAAAAGLAANLGDSVPVVRHDDWPVMNVDGEKRDGILLLLGCRDAV